MDGRVESSANLNASYGGEQDLGDEELSDGRMRHKHVVACTERNSLPSSNDSSWLAKTCVLFLGMQAGSSVLADTTPNNGDTINCNIIQNNDFVMKQIEKIEHCNLQLRQFEVDAAVCEARFEDRSYNNLETMEQSLVHSYCAQEVKQNRTAE